MLIETETDTERTEVEESVALEATERTVKFYADRAAAEADAAEAGRTTYRTLFLELEDKHRLLFENNAMEGVLRNAADSITKHSTEARLSALSAATAVKERTHAGNIDTAADEGLRLKSGEATYDAKRASTHAWEARVELAEIGERASRRCAVERETEKLRKRFETELEPPDPEAEA